MTGGVIVLAATPEARAVARAKVRENIERLGELGQARLDEVLAQLEEMRRRLNAMLATGTAFDQARARELIAVVDQETTRLRARLREPFTRAFQGAAQQGDADTVEYARMLIGREAPLSQGVSITLLDAAASRSADLVGQITETTRATLNQLLRRSAMGTSRPADVARDIGEALTSAARPTGVFGTLATQIERVHRTEVAGLYEQAGKSRTLQIARESPWQMQEVWITLRDGRERDDHRAMNGATIDVGESFNYGAGGAASLVSYERAQREGLALGTACMGPHDSILPAAAVVNCRCTRGLRRGPRKS